MTREDILKEILSLKGTNLLLELPTGLGKSKIAIEKIKSLRSRMGQHLLIVVPRNVHKQNWADELKKWWPKCDCKISYTTYVSFPKYKGTWDFVIFDECHHLSERCREALCDFDIAHSILLSATVSKTLKDEFKEVFDDLISYKKDLRDVIEGGILPDPKVYLFPIRLDTVIPSEVIVKNSRAKGKRIDCSWATRWNYLRQKEHPVRIFCTQGQYYLDLCNQIEYWKKKYYNTRSQIAKNKWLRLCTDRLKWLGDRKIILLHDILRYLAKYRTLTFCNSIEQTELLGEYCINSKNADSLKNLELFNSGRIDHITTCNILNEGMNLVNCQVGIYASLNSSNTIVKQRMGRLLRHPNPVIIIPYFKCTREEELVRDMLENYNPELITTISRIEEIKI